ncbi:MAG: hypothetical protein ACUVQZ_05050 [Candidatus Caldatribacteriaceae bacterium]
MKNHLYEVGFTLIEIVVSGFLTMLFVTLVLFQSHGIYKLERGSITLQRALHVAIGEMEALKARKKLFLGWEDKEKEGFSVRAEVEEFSMFLYRLTVVVKDQGGKEVVFLQTLRRK